MEDLPGNTVRIKIDVKEGDRAQIRQINIVGNNVFNDEDLLDQLKLQMPDWLSFIQQDDRYSREDLQGDLETIESFYLDRGYANFSIDSAQVAISPDKTGIFVTVNISEGDVYRLSDVKLTGEFVIPKEDIQRLVLAQPGQIFSQGLLTQATELIKYRLGEDGYSFAEVQAIPELDDENMEAKIVFYIQPKNRVYVRRVSFSDTTSINDDVLRRELRQMEGGYMSKSSLERSKIRLQRLPFIEEVEFDTIPVAGTTDLVDAESTIKEGLPGQFGGGIGYSGYQKLILNGNFVHTNFFGTGDRVALDLNSSRYRDLYSFSHTDAYTGLDEIARTTRFSYSSFNQFTASSSDFSTKTFSKVLEISLKLLSLSFLFKDSLSTIKFRASGFSSLKDKSSNSSLIRFIPIRSAKGAYISIVSFAFLTLFSELGTEFSVLILCNLSAILTSNTLISLEVASINFLKFSALEFFLALSSSAEILVTPSTKSATSLPNSSLTVL